MSIDFNNIDMTSTAHWVDEDWELFRDWIHGVLQMHTVSLKFEKKDGTIREMKCTLKEDVIPKVEESDRKQSNKTMVVYDLDKEGWRSFTIRSVREIGFSLGE